MNQGLDSTSSRKRGQGNSDSVKADLEFWLSMQWISYHYVYPYICKMVPYQHEQHPWEDMETLSSVPGSLFKKDANLWPTGYRFL